MKVGAVLQACANAGVRVWRQGERLRAGPPACLTDGLRTLLRENKPCLLAVVGEAPDSLPPSPDPIDLRDAFEERAAMKQFGGGMSREQAEREAAAETGFTSELAYATLNYK